MISRGYSNKDKYTIVEKKRTGWGGVHKRVLVIVAVSALSSSVSLIDGSFFLRCADVEKVDLTRVSPRAVSRDSQLKRWYNDVVGMRYEL